MLDFTQRIEELKLENDDLSNFQIDFTGEHLLLMGWCDGTKYEAGELGVFFIPTKKGYISSEWKNSKFYKEFENVGQDFINEIEKFHQVKKSKSFDIYNKSKGTTVANSISKMVNDSGSCLEEYINLER